MSHRKLSRRLLIGAMPYLGTATTVFGSALLSRPVSAETPSDPLRIYTQLRGRLDGEPGLWWYTGRLWGKRVTDVSVRLFHVDGFSFNRVTLRDDGGIDQEMAEVGFWRDPNTKELLDEWINPLNGLRCLPIHYRSKQILTFGPNGHLTAPKDPSGRRLRLEGWISPAVFNGSLVWSSESLIVKRLRPDPDSNQDPLTQGATISTQTSLVTYTGRADDIANPDAPWVPCSMNYHSLNSGWYPWMRMGQEMGGISFDLFGRKLVKLEDIPARLRNLIDLRYPDFLHEPGV